MTEVLAILVALVAALFGGAVWQRRQIVEARGEERNALATRARLVQADIDSKDRAIEIDTNKKVRGVKDATRVARSSTMTASKANKVIEEAEKKW